MFPINISLIGMAACGKSTFGVLLAKSLNLQFIDTDLLIQQKHGKLLMHIMEEAGTDGFVKIESEIICTLSVKNACIATGGSAVYSSVAMQHLKDISKIVFIDIPYDVIQSRISDIKSRGVVIEPDKTLYDIYCQRLELYKKYADITINGGNKSAEQIVNTIMTGYINFVDS